jgi:hypothetical protein
MKKNMGKTDRLIRVIIAIVISGLVVGNILTGTLAIVLLALAGVFLLTSIINFCPLYTLFGINTCPKD